jgi:hypothetical protein
MKRIVWLFASLLVISSPFLLITSEAYAATSNSNTAAVATNGYKISPVRTDLSIKPGDSDIVQVFVQNASSSVENVQTIVNDFEPPTDESGDPILLLNGQTAETHSLKQFITLQNPTFKLQPTQTATVSVLIKVPANTAAGGYYGAIRFAPLGANGNKNVNLSASVASLLLLTVPGNLNEQLSIAGFGVVQGSSFSTKSIFFNDKNISAIVRFQNEGNVQEQPFGKVLLKQGSKTIDTYPINDVPDPGNVLPSSIRRFTVTLTKLSWYGKYKVEGNFGYGSQGKLLSSSATFYIIPVLFIIIAILVILFILFLIFVLPKLIRRYNKRVIARANRARS